MSIIYLTISRAISFIKLFNLFIQKKKFQIIFANKTCEISNGVKLFNPKNIILGNNIFFGENVLLNASKGGFIKIGDNTNLAADIKIISWINDYDENNKGKGSIPKDVEIGKNCRIGYNVIIMPGVKIGDSVTIAPMSVVLIDVPSDSTVMGNPAKIIN